MACPPSTELTRDILTRNNCMARLSPCSRILLIQLFAFHRQGLQGPIGPQVLNHIHVTDANLNKDVLLTRHAVFAKRRICDDVKERLRDGFKERSLQDTLTTNP